MTLMPLWDGWTCATHSTGFEPVLCSVTMLASPKSRQFSMMLDGATTRPSDATLGVAAAVGSAVRVGSVVGVGTADVMAVVG
jgi:hypothetical protein